MVIVYDLDASASEKQGLRAITDAGNVAFRSSTLSARNGGTSAFGGGTKMSFPRWVDVTWRMGIDEHKGSPWETGVVVASYRVPVLERIPEAVFAYTKSGRGRAIVLRFRVKDDGVLVAWDVQETVRHPSVVGGTGAFVYSIHGGDFPCEYSKYQGRPNCTDGRLEDAPWYMPIWIRG